MNAFVGKTPFFRLLLPVIAGIAACALLPAWAPSLYCLISIGLILIFLSCFFGINIRYSGRWVFGAGLYLFLFSLAILQYREQEKNREYFFSNESQYYTGVLLDIPEIKPRSIACNVKISYPYQQKVKLYLAQDSASRELKPADEIIFYARIQPFRNFGNPDDFDYVQYMKIKGFTGSTYIPESDWQKTGRQSHAITPQSQRLRLKALTMYRSLIDNKDACAFISALTLGYRGDLSDDIQEAFRASGTAHVLAVSGLHVGIIYMIISLMFSFLGKSGWRFILRQSLVILTLWIYVFLAGGSASVMRAAIMLSFFCLGNMINQRGFTYNTLAAAAFFILLFNPFSLFDISFQMSFSAVAAILYFQPKLYALYKPKGRIKKYVWDLFTVSTAAQLGVFPLVLYYFGTFPTWFFITNLLVVPLIGIIIYASAALVAVDAINRMAAGFFDRIESLLQWIAETLTEITLRIVQISESLPFAQLADSFITTIQLPLMVLFVFLFATFLYTHRAEPLIIALASLFAFQMVTLENQLHKPPPQLVVFNSSGRSEIALFAEGKRHFLSVPGNGFLPHPQKRILHLSDDALAGFVALSPFPVDILVLSDHAGFKMGQLLSLFEPSLVVLDSSLPPGVANRMTVECGLLGIQVHDVTKEGAFSLIF
ncbi:MAG: ComEC family competence protein [Porphyromonadaceae bacterium]|nr:ComEC family competence protein [Porphyromonadaceae bacterium]